MVGASFAAVPLYSWFCRTTGFGGTTQVRQAAPTQISGRTITVHFDFERRRRPAVGVRARAPHHRRQARPGRDHLLTSPTSRARHHRSGRLQRQSADHRHLLRKDQLLLLYPADAEAGREARHGGGVLRRSEARQGRRAGRHQDDHAVLYVLSGEGAGTAGRDDATDPEIRPHLTKATTTARPAIRPRQGGDNDDGRRRPRQTHHDYHLVNPSLWPASGDFGFSGRRRGILWMHHFA